jgi:hypothetical protein
MRTGRLPNLIIAGVNKAGTTSLYTSLRRHPSVCGSSVKETCYFLPLRYGESPAPLDDYRAFFSACSDAEVIMEATPGYFYGGAPLAEEIRRSVDNVKVIVVLREPVSRLASFHRFQQSMLTIPAEMTLAEYVKACDSIEPDRFPDRSLDQWFGVQAGHYDLYLADWIETFGADLRVLFFDDIIGDTRRTLRALAAWLQIPSEPFDRDELDAENRSVPVRNVNAQRMALTLNRRLEPLFRARPASKALLRRIYYRFNAAQAVQEPDDELAHTLRLRYATSNQRTAAQLRGAGYSTLPGWLSCAE